MAEYNKLTLRAEFEIEGVTNELERELAGTYLLSVYNRAADFMNEKGIDMFHSLWDSIHPDEENEFDDDEYIRAYDRFLKSVTDDIINKTLPEGRVYRLRTYEPLIIKPAKGCFVLYGYKEN